MIVDGREGFVVDVGDADGLAQAAATLADDKDLRSACGEQAVCCAARLDWKVLIPRYVSELYMPVFDELR